MDKYDQAALQVHGIWAKTNRAYDHQRIFDIVDGEETPHLCMEILRLNI